MNSAFSEGTLLAILLIAVPGLTGLAAFAIRSDRLRRPLLPATALVHLALTVAAWVHRAPAAAGDWLILDSTGVFFLSITSLLFLVIALHTTGYLASQQSHPGTGSEAVFTGCLLLFLAVMTLVELSAHFGLLWVAVEATTLASAPLLYHHRSARSLEAVWKYLLICSVGIALALLGTFFLMAAVPTAGQSMPLTITALSARASELGGSWLKAALVLLFVGYGTKAGFFPLHTWLPDAHSEAPSPVSALLSGSLLNCAVLALMRAQQVAVAAGLGSFGRSLFLLFGILSVAMAAVFMVRQSDYKRLLAYSSVENIGLVALGLGLGGFGAFGGLLHALNHSLAKASLFMTSGNFLTAFRSKRVDRVGGALGIVPLSAMLWLTGMLALTGTPPFGAFLSKFLLLRTAASQGRYGLLAVVLLPVVAIFAGMSAVILRMVWGTPPPPPPGLEAPRPLTEKVWMWLPPLLLLATALALGFWVPAGLDHLLREIVATLGGMP